MLPRLGIPELLVILFIIILISAPAARRISAAASVRVSATSRTQPREGPNDKPKGTARVSAARPAPWLLRSHSPARRRGHGSGLPGRDPPSSGTSRSKLHQTDDAEHRKRFAREARAIAALNHPNIVTIHSVEEVDGQPFLTMELVEGTPLNRLIPHGGFELPELLSIAVPISEGPRGRSCTRHRPPRPQAPNVMVCPDGRVKMLDFGLAKHIEAASHRECGRDA